jgi:hypothetical protein
MNMWTVLFGQGYPKLFFKSWHIQVWGVMLYFVLMMVKQKGMSWTGRFIKNQNSPWILIFCIFLRMCTYICLELEPSSLHYIWNILTSIGNIGCSKMTKFSQNKIVKITCINKGLSIAHKNDLWLFLKLVKSTFLQNMKTLFMTNFFFILRQKLKPVSKVYF